ncbi:putative PI3/PI4-kinase family protein [Gracilariopsis chorda]|uniref:Putative PI3/PI4-kinase family protein n=1 Tax=Gracilariopsis chorda TaxID=448386 RepID=A0A2V3IDF6_9FLOR|nr:putative PI3/PI4-kinase family protein [Gracilariopsis chorda]|eukprot:PXF40119.1 putative PI3/PI4-kinase family protein [Gracilariopsis chorda]
MAGKPQPVRIAPSTQSFKVIMKCPLLIMLLFQLYPQMVQKNIYVLLPLMVQAIQFEIPVQIFAKIPKTTFNEFIAAQVKTVSFLAYLLKRLLIG